MVELFGSIFSSVVWRSLLVACEFWSFLVVAAPALVLSRLVASCGCAPRCPNSSLARPVCVYVVCVCVVCAFVCRYNCDIYIYIYTYIYIYIYTHTHTHISKTWACSHTLFYHFSHLLDISAVIRRRDLYIPECIHIYICACSHTFFHHFSHFLEISAVIRRRDLAVSGTLFGDVTTLRAGLSYLDCMYVCMYVCMHVCRYML